MKLLNTEFEGSEIEIDHKKKELESSLKRSKEIQKNYESNQKDIQEFRDRNKELEIQLKDCQEKCRKPSKEIEGILCLLSDFLKWA